MVITNSLVTGPFKDEEAFKAALLAKWRKNNNSIYYFEIENEEKEPGMPDVLAMPFTPLKTPAWFYEFKISDDNGFIKFEKSQPLFYKRYKNLVIRIIAWDKRHNRIIIIDVKELTSLKKSLTFKLPEGT